MILYNFMQDLVNVHKNVYKKFNTEKTFHSKNFTMEVGISGIDIIRNEYDDPKHGKCASHSAFTISTANGTVNHPNNAMEFVYGVSSFFRMSSGDEITITDLRHNQSQVLIPRYNDNEGELLFTMSTITGCALPIVLASILLTLDTQLATMYTYRMTEADIDEFIELLGVAKSWITSNTVTS